MRKLILSLAFLTLPLMSIIGSSSQPVLDPVFPGCKGWGCGADQFPAASTAVIVVDSTASSGSETTTCGAVGDCELQEAFSMAANRAASGNYSVIIFNASGVYAPTGVNPVGLSIPSNTIVSGATSSGGFVISNQQLTQSASTHIKNFIIQNIAIRPAIWDTSSYRGLGVDGTSTACSSESDANCFLRGALSLSCVSLGGSEASFENIVVDRISCTFFHDEGVSFTGNYPKASFFSVTNSLIASGIIQDPPDHHGDDDMPKGGRQSTSGGTTLGGSPLNAGPSTWERNLFAFGWYRNPRIFVGQMEIVNNAFYGLNLNGPGIGLTMQVNPISENAQSFNYPRIDFYGNEFRYGPIKLSNCSITTGTLCRNDGDCPGVETCGERRYGKCSITTSMDCDPNSPTCPGAETCGDLEWRGWIGTCNGGSNDGLPCAMGGGTSSTFGCPSPGVCEDEIPSHIAIRDIGTTSEPQPQHYFGGDHHQWWDGSSWNTQTFPNDTRIGGDNAWETLASASNCIGCFGSREVWYPNRRTSANFRSPWAYTTVNASSVWDTIDSTVGVVCPSRVGSDTDVVNAVTNGSVMPSSNIPDVARAGVGDESHFSHDLDPPNAAASQWIDLDGDGCSDSWENTHWGNTTTSTCVSDTDGDGYIDVIEWINGSNPTTYTDGFTHTFSCPTGV